MNVSAEALGQIGEFLVGVSTVTTVAVGFLRREWIGTWLRDRRDLAREMKSLKLSIADAELHARRAAEAVKAQSETISAQSETIDILREEIKELKEIKLRFTALMSWIPAVLDYVAFLERIVTPMQRSGRSMPALPDILLDHVQVEDRP